MKKNKFDAIVICARMSGGWAAKGSHGNKIIYNDFGESDRAAKASKHHIKNG